MTRKQRTACGGAITGVVILFAGCVAQTFGGMTVHDAFPDTRVAALVEAVTHSNFAEADKQLKAGADVNMVGADGVSALMWVMATRNVKGVEYMLKVGANPNYRDEKRKASAMVLGAGGDKPDVLELLLKHKGDPNLVGPRGEPLLHIAVEQFRDKNIQLLIGYGGDVNVVNSLGRTAAQDAVALGRLDLVTYFLEQGLNHNLDGLAITVFATQVSAQQSWKDKVIEMLKARGVKYPPDWPRKNPSQTH